MSESALHVQVADYLRQALRAPVFWTSVDAGAGELSPKAAALCKARGIRAGVPDLLVFLPETCGGTKVVTGNVNDPTSKDYGRFTWGPVPPVASRVIGIELKTVKGRVSPVQAACHAEMALAGCRIRVARSLDDVERILTLEGVPLHARPYPLLQRKGAVGG